MDDDDGLGGGGGTTALAYLNDDNISLGGSSVGDLFASSFGNIGDNDSNSNMNQLLLADGEECELDECLGNLLEGTDDYGMPHSLSMPAMSNKNNNGGGGGGAGGIDGGGLNHCQSFSNSHGNASWEPRRTGVSSVGNISALRNNATTARRAKSTPVDTLRDLVRRKQIATAASSKNKNPGGAAGALLYHNRARRLNNSHSNNNNNNRFSAGGVGLSSVSEEFEHNNNNSLSSLFDQTDPIHQDNNNNNNPATGTTEGRISSVFDQPTGGGIASFLSQNNTNRKPSEGVIATSISDVLRQSRSASFLKNKVTTSPATQFHHRQQQPSQQGNATFNNNNNNINGAFNKPSDALRKPPKQHNIMMTNVNTATDPPPSSPVTSSNTGMAPVFNNPSSSSGVASFLGGQNNHEVASAAGASGNSNNAGVGGGGGGGSVASALPGSSSGIASFLASKTGAPDASIPGLTALQSQQQQLQNLLQQQQAAPQQQQQQHEQQKVDTTLHRLCCNPYVTVEDIDRVVRQNPAAASQAATLYSNRSVYSPSLHASEAKQFKETYAYPINLAIKYKAPPNVIEMLVDAAPSVLLEKDGPQMESPMHVLLRYQSHNLSAVDCFLLKCPRIAAVKDRHDNTPLHVACSKGASIDIVKHLCILYYEPLFMRNFQGHTPLDLCQQRTSACSDEVAVFLYEEQTRRGPT